MISTMRCRCNCGGKIYVTETRATEDVIWRTRKCKDCGSAYTTKEEAVEGNIPREAHAPCNRKRNAPAARMPLESANAPEPRNQHPEQRTASSRSPA